MPIMDGYEATKLIRKLDNNKSKIPILGMSARAMISEKNKCLSLGMNDYIAKPFDPKILSEKIQNLIGLNKSEISETKEQTTLINKENFKFINLKLLDKAYRGNVDKIKKILKISLENIPVQISDLSKNYDKNDIKGLRVVAHSLKTTFNYLGLSNISIISKNIESFAATNKNLSQVPDMIKAIEKVWESAKNEIIKYIENNQNSIKPN